MRRRLVWLLGGWLVGTATAAWLRRRIRRGVERYTPEHLRREVADRGTDMLRSVRRVAGEVTDATRAGRDEVRRTRHTLDHEYGARRRHRPFRSVG